MCLCASGTPCSGPRAAPLRWLLSAASAAARAPFQSMSTKQFSRSLSRAIRSRQASTTSRDVVWPAAIALAASVSGARDQSVMLLPRSDLEQGGLEVARIDIEVDLAVPRLDRPAQLLELDRQFLDTPGFELKLRVTFVHQAHKLAGDHWRPFCTTAILKQRACLGMWLARYPRHNCRELAMATAAGPIIDISPYRGGDAADRRALAAEIDRICRQLGFLVIAGHGVDPDLVSAVETASRAFFDLPLEGERRILPPAPDLARRFLPLQGEVLGPQR